jgi:DNA-binding transcriptional MerR regulator
MVRKRDAYTRARARRRRRPKSPAPTEGFLIRDVARLSGVSVRTLRDHVGRGLLRYSEARGTVTRYPRREVIRLLAALRLKAQTRASWAELKRQLDASSEAHLEAGLDGQLPSAVAVELGLVKDPNTAGDAARSDETPRERAEECWYRTVLLPGLELFVSATASPLVLQAAARLVRENLGPGPR